MRLQQRNQGKSWNWDAEHLIHVTRIGKKFHFDAHCAGINCRAHYAIQACVCMPVVSDYDEELWISDIDQCYHHSPWADRDLCDELGKENGYVRRRLMPCALCTADGQLGERASGSNGI